MRSCLRALMQRESFWHVWQSMVNMLCCKVFPIFRMHNVQFDKLPDVSLCVMYVLQLSLKSDLVY